MNIVVANWKMNPNSAKEAEALFDAVAEEAKKSKNVEIVICPPFCYLPLFQGSKNIKLGAQNCHWELAGAYTGEVSAIMLADLGISYVILGHSERRQFLGETDAIVNLKIKTALKAKLKPTLCVGEKEGEEMNIVVEEQVTKALAGLNINQMKEIVIAYEPVWAIGTGRSCEPDNALSAALFIRRICTKLYSRFLAENLPVLYGGSVSAQNAENYIKTARMDGLLVGGASLDAGGFIKIIENIKYK